MTSKDLATQLGVSGRTARRDLTTLRALGYPLTSVGSRWLFIEGQGLPTSMASDGAGEESARDRILSLDGAIRARRTVEVRYWSPGAGGGSLKMTLAPLALHFVDGSLFLVAREHPVGPWRALAVERLAGVRRRREKIPRSVADGLEGYLEHQLRTDADRELSRVQVRFEPQAAWRVRERVWHPSQRVHLQPDGVVVVSMRVPGFVWVKAWVLGFGTAAVVLSPPELIRAVCQELEDTRETYRNEDLYSAQLDLFGNGT
jgi:predicted DNA-binding transcriptional regulator YafY